MSVMSLLAGWYAITARSVLLGLFPAAHTDRDVHYTERTILRDGGLYRLLFYFLSPLRKRTSGPFWYGCVHTYVCFLHLITCCACITVHETIKASWTYRQTPHTFFLAFPLFSSSLTDLQYRFVYIQVQEYTFLHLSALPPFLPPTFPYSAALLRAGGCDSGSGIGGRVIMVQQSWRQW